MKSLLFIRWFLIVAVIGGLTRLSAQAPAAIPSAGDAKVYDYTLALTDRIRVSIFQEEELSVIARIDAKGCVNLNLVGEVRVAGMTRREAQKTVENAYREGRFLRNPQVTITVEDYALREVSIQGQVRAPGRYPLPIESTMTVLELVLRAGGLTDTAKGTEVSITRVTLDGEKTIKKVDVESLIKGKNRAKASDSSLLLEPGDIVYVPERII